MSCGRATPKVSKYCFAPGNVLVYHWFTDWMPSEGLDSARAVRKIHGALAAANNAQVTFAFQTAKVRTDKPDPPQQAPSTNAGGTASYITGPDAEAQTATLDLTIRANNAGYYNYPIQDAFFVRFGIAIDNTTSADLVQGEVEMQVAFNQCGEILGTATYLAAASVANVETVTPITKWVPYISVAKVKAALVMTGTTSGTTPTATLCYQTSAADPNTGASEWQIGTTKFTGSPNVSTSTNNAEFSTLDVVPNQSTGDMWIRFGISYKNNTAGAQSHLSVAIASRSS